MECHVKVFCFHCSSVRLRYQLQPWPAGAKTPVNFAIETFGYQMDGRVPPTERGRGEKGFQRGPKESNRGG